MSGFLSQQAIISRFLCGDFMRRFARFQLLINDKMFKKIKNTTVALIGVGGVGGYALEALVRSGVSNIIIIDNDKIDITNLNRQIIALENNIGQSKVDVAKTRVLAINPEVNITCYETFLLDNNLDLLDNFSLDYIIDACDTITTKIALIKYAKAKKIKIISSMGTGKRLDATKLTITTLDKTQNDPIAKILRKKLKELNISLKIPVIWSKELPLKITSKEIPSCSYVPGVAGLYIANYIINDIIKSSNH